MSFNTYRAHTDGVAAVSPTWRSWPTDAEQPVNSLIAIWAHNDGGGTVITISDSHASDPNLGWVELFGPNPSNSSTRTALFYRRRTGAVIPEPVLSGSNDEWVCYAEVMPWAAPTTAIDASAVTNQTSSTTVPAAPSVNTTTANCVIRRYMGFDGTSTAPVPRERFGTYFIVGGAGENPNSTGSTAAVTITHQVQESIGPTGTFTFAAGGTDGGRQMTVAFRVAPGFPIPAYPKPLGVDPAVSYPFPQGSYYTSATDLSTIISTIEGITVQSGTPSIGTSGGISNEATLDQGFIGGWSNIVSTQAATPSGPAGYYGTVVNLTNGPVDWANNLFAALIRMPADNQRATDIPALVFMDGSSNYSIIRPALRKTVNNFFFCVCTPSTFTPVESSGSINWAAVTRFGVAKYATNNTAAFTRSNNLNIKYLLALPRGVPLASLHGAVDISSIEDLLKSFGVGDTTASVQGGIQLLARLGFQLGDTSAPVQFAGEGASIAFPFQNDGYSVQDGDNLIRLKLSSTDSVDLASMAVVSQDKAVTFQIDAASSPDGLVGTSAVMIGQGLDLANSGPLDGAAVVASPKAQCYSADLSNCTVKSTLATDAAAYWTGNASFVDGVIDLTDVTCQHHVELGTAVTAFDLSNTLLTGTPSISNIWVRRTTGTVTITLAEGQAVPTYTSAGALVEFDQPVSAAGISFTGLVPGSQVVVYTAGTTTELFRTDNSGASESYSVLSPSVSLDYTIQKAGYVPIRVAGIVTSSVLPAPISQQVDRAYVASTGLTYGVNTSVNAGTKRVGLTTASTLQNFYSFLIEAWIAQSALRNVTFPILPNGPDSFTLANDWEWDGAASINYLSRDGMRYLNASGQVTAIWSAILSLGDVAGALGEYQQVLGAAPTNNKATGPIDQLIQVYGDAAHGNFDYRNYLYLKFQPNGYRPADVDVVATYGTLADSLYIVSATTPVISAMTPGNPGVTGLSITNHGASPVTWDAGNGNKQYSITITDSGTNTAAQVHAWVNYNLSLDAMFGGTDPFNWPEMVVHNGDAHETARGTILGSAGAALKGIRVIRTGAIPHPGFARFQADDGTYGQPLATQIILVPNLLDGTKVRVLNENPAYGERYIGTVTGGGGFAITLTAGTDYTAGDQIRVVATYASGTTYKKPYAVGVVATSGTATFSDPQLDWDEPNIHALDWTDVDECETDYVNIQVDVNDLDNIGYKLRYAIFITGALTEDDGIRNWVSLTGVPVIIWKDAVNVVIDTAAAAVTIINEKPASKLRVADDFAFKWSDGIDHVDAVLGSSIIWVNPSEVASLEVGSAVTPQDILDIADAVWDEPTASHTAVGSTGEALTTGGGLTAQQVRDAMLLAPTGLATTNSIDQKLDDLETAINAVSIAGSAVMYTPTSAIRVVGDDEGGTVTDLAAKDGTYFRTGETVAGLDVIIEVATTNTDQTPSVARVSGFYDGGNSHNVSIYAWNYLLSAWQYKATMSPRSDPFDYAFAMTGDNAEAGTGKMRLRFLHNVVNYSTNDYLSLDAVVFEKLATNAQLAQDVATILANQQALMAGEILHQGFAQGPGPGTNTIVLAASASPYNGSYDPGLIHIKSGSGFGQSAIILQYDGTTKTAVVHRDWKQPIDTSSEYEIHAYSDSTTVNEGLIQAATSSTVTLNTNASSVDGTYVGQLIFLLSGPGADQSALITSYNGTTKVANIVMGNNSGWAQTPTSQTAYKIIPASPVIVAALAHNGATFPANHAPAAQAVRTELTAELGQVTATKNLVEADEYHTATTVEKRLKGTSTVLLTKNHSGTPLNNLQVVQP